MVALVYAFAKRKIELSSLDSRKLIADARLMKLAPKTDGKGAEKCPPLSYLFEAWDGEDCKHANVVVTVEVTADNKRSLKEYNDRILECFGEGRRDRKEKKKGASKFLSSRRGVRSTFRRVFLRAAWT
ncbi:hypothetical protein J3458_003574 [Metarhizium acridum]|uniref:uncharacterized protein n=1 Tax=Metarhizium acridum TaxID=92637 RepID=UPI001C6C412F|nr:hypothetical protein J3458_003574 [Metarhizium acridum]